MGKYQVVVGKVMSGQVEATKCEDVVINQRVGKGQAALGKCQAVVLRTQVCTPDVRFGLMSESTLNVICATRNCLHDGDYVFFQVHLSDFVGLLSGFVGFLSGFVAFLSGLGGVMFVHTNT